MGARGAAVGVAYATWPEGGAAGPWAACRLLGLRRGLLLLRRPLLRLRRSEWRWRWPNLSSRSSPWRCPCRRLCLLSRRCPWRSCPCLRSCPEPGGRGSVADMRLGSACDSGVAAAPPTTERTDGCGGGIRPCGWPCPGENGLARGAALAGRSEYCAADVYGHADGAADVTAAAVGLLRGAGVTPALAILSGPSPR